MAQRLLVCGIGSGMERSLPLIERLDVELVVVTERPTDRARGAGRTVLRADPGDHASVAAALAEAGVRHLDGVLSLGYDNPPVIARLCRQFGCPGLDEEVALDCTLKDRRIRLLSQHGLDTPRHFVADDVAGALARLEQLGLPAVVKPADRTNSIGVAKLDSMRTAPARIRQAWDHSRCKRVVLEEFLEGTEHTVAGIAVDGAVHVTGFSDREYGRKEAFAPYFFEEGDTVPSALDPARVELVLHAVRRGLRALGLHTAVFNSDVLLTPDRRVILLELTGRMTGARIATEVIPLATGVNLLQNAVRLALGRRIEEAELRPTRNRAAVQRYLPADGGTVAWVGDLAQVATDPNLYDLFWGMRLAPGTALPRLRSNNDVIAGAIASGDTVPEAEAVARDALRRIPLCLVR